MPRWSPERRSRWMADATSSVTLELHGFLADRLAALGRRRGSRVLISVAARPSVVDLLAQLAEADNRYALLFDRSRRALPEHVEVVLNKRVLDLQGGLQARL